MYPEFPTSRPETRPRRSAPAVAALALLVGLATGALLTPDASGGDEAAAPSPGTEHTLAVSASPATVATPTVPAAGETADDLDPEAIAQAVVPSVVTVEVGVATGTGFGRQGSGSGVVIAAGLIVTNDHVATAGPEIRIVLADGRIYPAELVGLDPVTDLAVLRIDANGLVPIVLGSTDDLAVGAAAVAVGSPLGLEGGPSLTVGVVSALGREVQTGPATTLYGMLQTDAPITSGSSGGALVDGLGRLIGITTAVGVSEVGIEGIGFATPVEIVERVTTALSSEGEVRHARLGISGTTAFDATGDGGTMPAGVEVISVEPGSAAATGGIEPGDVITAVGGAPVDTMEELIARLRRHLAGDRIDLVLLRAGTELALPLGLGAMGA